MDDGFFAGQLLIAMPGITDPRFERALILICAHDAGHAMGVAVNNPVDGLSVPELLMRLEVRSEAPPSDELVLLGGPVEPERGFVVHTGDYASEHSLAIAPDLALTATRDVLEAMAAGGGSPRRAILALGYAGWGAGQLEDEIKSNVWLTCEADEALIFGAEHERKWSRALAKLGVGPERLGAVAGRA